jgi:Golgi nucleoside diphosphatase
LFSNKSFLLRRSGFILLESIPMISHLPRSTFVASCFLLVFLQISAFAFKSSQTTSIADDEFIIGNFYAVVIDAGSTGSRSFVFNITETLSSDRNVGDLANQRCVMCDFMFLFIAIICIHLCMIVCMYVGFYLRTERHIISIARKKERPGLSTFGTSSSHEIVNYIAQFLIDAATVIPEEYHNTTQVRLTLQ